LQVVILELLIEQMTKSIMDTKLMFDNSNNHNI